MLLHNSLAQSWRVLAILCLTSTLASAGNTARLVLEVDSGRAMIVGTRFEIAVPDLRDELLALASELATGSTATEARRALGTELLGPLREGLETYDHWVIQPSGSATMSPGALASLPTLIAPWSDTDLPVLAEHVISFQWPLGLHQPAPRESSANPSAVILLAAPFHTGIEPAIDDPDTLRRALSKAARTVRLLPRNETDAQSLRRALESTQPSLLWLRTERGAFTTLRPASGAYPSVVIWTLPSRSTERTLGLESRDLSSGGAGPESIIASVWPVSETDAAGMYSYLIDALARGIPAGQALQHAQLRALEANSPVPLVASLVCIGNAEAVVEIQRSSWLRRKFGGL